MDNFIEEFLKVTRFIESPTSYLEWAAYTAISAVMRDNAYIRFGAFRRTYPNIYVLFIGDSAATRKSSPLKAINKIVKLVNNTKVIEGRASIQAVLGELAAVKNRTVGGVNKTLSGASALLYSEELASFLVKDTQISGILDDLYEYQEEHPVILRSQEIIILKDVCVSFIAATNTIFLQDMFSKVDLYGGLVGRFIILVESKARHKDLGFDDPTTDLDLEPLVRHLVELSRKRGIIKLTEDAVTYFNDWYQNTDFSRNESKTGFEHRAHSHVLKLAIILAAAEPKFDLLLERRHIVESITKTTALWSNYKRLTTSISTGSTPITQCVTEVMVALVKSNRPIDREMLLSTLLGRVDAEMFDKAVTTLEQSGLLNIGGSACKVTYEISGKGRKMFLSELETKGKVN